jgi:flagellar assembly factor FliW
VTGLTFVTPLPGLDSLTEYNLEQLDGSDGVYTLESAGSESRLFLLDPVVYVPGYHPELTDEQAATLKLVSPDEAAMFVIANHQDGETSVNLAAPIIVNTVTDMCAQFILEGQGWPVRAPLGA